ncbi:MAG: acyltransferase family protein [Saprospiraceae bacterium]|jgi:predicted acyltransferase
MEKTNTRLLSLDVFRGMTIAGMILVNNPGDWGNIYAPLKHAVWHGCTPTDWIFPFFLFIVGVSIAIALGRRKADVGGGSSIYGKIAYRTAVIFGLGLFLAAFPKFKFEGNEGLLRIHYVLLGIATIAVFLREVLNQRQFEQARHRNIRKWLGFAAIGAALGMFVIGLGHYHLGTLRIPGVLQRIAVVYGIASLLFVHFSPRAQTATAAILLVGYWVLMTFVPVPGGIAPNLEPGTNLGAWLDRTVLGTDHLWSQSKTWDPEGILSTLPAIATALIGVRSGAWLRSPRKMEKKVPGLLVAGIILILAGQAWNLIFPINKSLWTSAFVLYTAGLAQIFLGLCYWLIDVQNWKKWAKPFEIFGVNALFAFVLSGILAKLMSAIKWQVDEERIQTVRGWLYQTFFTPNFEPVNASLAFALFHIAFIFLCAWALYRNKIFIKV